MIGTFSIDPNMTPQQIAERRARIAALMPQFGKAKYIGEGLGQLFMGIGQGRQQSQLDATEKANQDAWHQQLNGAFGGVSGSLTVLGIPPADPITSSPIVDPNSPQGIASDTMAALGHGPVDESFVVNGLMQRGMPEHIARGYATNFRDESAFNPAASGDNGRALGLGQWNGPRKAALEAFAASQGKPASDPNVQLDFVMQENAGPEAAAWSKISTTKDPASAAAAVLNYCERHSEQTRARREASYLGNTDTTVSTMGGGGQTQGGPSLEQLYQLSMSPWASPEERAAIQSMIAQRTPDASLVALDQRARMAGLQPGTKEYQDFMRMGPGMTGRALSLTPFFTKDANGQTHAFQLSPNGPPVEIPLPQGMAAMDPYGKAFDTAAGGAEGKAQGEAGAAATSLASKMGGLEDVVKQLDKLAEDGTYTAAGRAINWLSKETGFGATKGALARTQYQAIVNDQILPLLRDTFGAAFTAKEGETLQATLGDLNMTPAEKQAVLRAFIEQKKRDLAAMQLQSGQTGATGATGNTGTDLTPDELKYLGAP